MIEGFKQFLLAKLVDKDGHPLSNKYPMSSAQSSGVSALQNIIRERNVFLAHGVNVAANAGNLSKIQLWNPADSDKLLVCYVASMWHTSGSVTYKASVTSNQLSNNESLVASQNACFGSSQVAKSKIYTKNDDATSASNVISQMPVSSIASNGTNILASLQGVAMPGYGVLIEPTTANMAINALLTWCEIDLDNIPAF